MKKIKNLFRLIEHKDEDISFLKENGYESIQQSEKEKEHYIKMENSLF